LLNNLPTKASEDDVAEFFETNAGPVLDIQLIVDRFTRRSKGVGYVEFADLASVPSALACSGRMFMGFSVNVQATQSQKNKLAANAASALLRGPRQLFIGGLPAGVTDADVRDLVSAVGLAEQCSVRPGINNGLPELHAYVVLGRPEEALQLMNELNGQMLGGSLLRCGLIDDQSPPMPPAPVAALGMPVLPPQPLHFVPLPMQPAVLPPLPSGLPQQIGGNMFANIGSAPESLEQDLPRLNAAGKQALMAQLQRRAESSRSVVLRNMFDPPNSIVAKQSAEPFDAAAIREDVREEASQFGRVLHCVVESSSGCVYLTFDSVDAAGKCISSLHHRYFGGKVIVAEFIEEARVPFD
jgi:RNA-binding protein 39